MLWTGVITYIIPSPSPDIPPPPPHTHRCKSLSLPCHTHTHTMTNPSPCSSSLFLFKLRFNCISFSPPRANTLLDWTLSSPSLTVFIVIWTPRDKVLTPARSDKARLYRVLIIYVKKTAHEFPLSRQRAQQ